jgi:DNA-binding LacI/PurR family transcriptional regulator
MRDAPNVSAASRRKVRKAAAELGYRPNAVARSLASKHVRTLGVLVNDVRNPYFGALFASLAQAAAEAGYDILTAPGTRAPSSEGGLINTLLEHQVAGLALLSPLLGTSELRGIVQTHPTVVVGREVGIPGVDVVTTDELAAARTVVDRLLELGHTDIAHITGGGNRPARDRARAFRRAMTERGLEPRVVPGSFTEAGGRQGAERLLADGRCPTALVAANDLIAVGAMGVFRAAGIRVPEDLSVVGYDDSQIARLDLVRLTSVRQAIDQFGTAAVAALVARFADPTRAETVQRLGTVLVERATVGPARRRSRFTRPAGRARA